MSSGRGALQPFGIGGILTLMKGASLTSTIFAGSARNLLATLALILTFAGAVASATACCCPPERSGPAHESPACPDGDEHGSAPAHHESHDPCRDLVCPPQAAAIETAALEAQSTPIHSFGFAADWVAPCDPRNDADGAVAIFATEHGPPVRTALHSILRL